VEKVPACSRSVGCTFLRNRKFHPEGVGEFVGGIAVKTLSFIANNLMCEFLIFLIFGKISRENRFSSVW
jgi:hypothetical protein